MHPPAFAEDEGQLALLGRQAKGWVCPHCRQAGTLNGHGWLRGNDETNASRQAVRGRRFFCSNRGRRPGCGRTWLVRLAQVLARASVRTATWWRFVAARLGGASVLQAWESTRRGFSVEAAYRWWRRWRAQESAVRTGLCRGRAPPDGLGEAITRSYGPADPVAAFQGREQRSWPGFAS